MITENTQPTTRYRVRTTDFVNIGGKEVVEAISSGFVPSKRYREQVPRPIMAVYAIEDALHALENGRPLDVDECVQAVEEIGYMISLVSEFRDRMVFIRDANLVSGDANLGLISLGIRVALTQNRDEGIKALKMALRIALMFVEPDRSECDYIFAR